MRGELASRKQRNFFQQRHLLEHCIGTFVGRAFGITGQDDRSNSLGRLDRIGGCLANGRP